MLHYTPLVSHIERKAEYQLSCMKGRSDRSYVEKINGNISSELYISFRVKKCEDANYIMQEYPRQQAGVSRRVYKRRSVHLNWLNSYICRTSKLGMKILKQQVQRMQLISVGSQVKWIYKTSSITQQGTAKVSIYQQQQGEGCAKYHRRLHGRVQMY